MFKYEICKLQGSFFNLSLSLSLSLSCFYSWDREGKFSSISISVLTGTAQPPGTLRSPSTALTLLGLSSISWRHRPGEHPAKTLPEPFRNPHLRNPHKNPGHNPPANPATGVCLPALCRLLLHFPAFLNGFFFFFLNSLPPPSS